MVTKTADSPTVIEFTMDEEQFKEREAKGEEVFQGVLKYRAPGGEAEVRSMCRDR